MPDTPDNLDEKVQAIFCKLDGEDRAKWLRATIPSRVMDQIASALSPEHDIAVAAEIGFHVGDWQADAAFLVALHLFPERFTPEEIDEGVRSLLLHVPAHVIAAARLAGHSPKDIFCDDNAT
jgi:hypothetical protein